MGRRFRWHLSAATAAGEGGCGGGGGRDGAGQHAVEVCGGGDASACGWDGEAGEEGLGVAGRGGCLVGFFAGGRAAEDLFDEEVD